MWIIYNIHSIYNTHKVESMTLHISKCTWCDNRQLLHTVYREKGVLPQPWPWILKFATSDSKPLERARTQKDMYTFQSKEHSVCD